MLKINILCIISFSILSLLAKELKEEDWVTKISYTDYKELNGKTDIFVFFYDPSCRYCQIAKYEIIQAAAFLKEYLPNLKFVKVDITTDKNAGEEEGIRNLPTLKVLRIGFPEEILKLYMKTNLINSIFRIYYGSVLEIRKLDIGQKILEIAESTLIFTGHTSDDTYEQFLSVASVNFFPNTFFMQIENREILKQLVIPTKNKIVLHRSFNDQILPYLGNINNMEIKAFLELHSKPPVIPFAFTLMQEFFLQRYYLIVLFTKERNSESAKLKVSMEDAVIKLRSNNISVHSTIVSEAKDDEDRRTMEDLVGVQNLGRPSVF